MSRPLSAPLLPLPSLVCFRQSRAAASFRDPDPWPRSTARRSRPGADPLPHCVLDERHDLTFWALEAFFVQGRLEATIAEAIYPYLQKVGTSKLARFSRNRGYRLLPWSLAKEGES